MMNLQKKLFCLIMITFLALSTSSNVVYANEQNHQHNHEFEYNDIKNSWTKEIVVEVNSEEEFLKYPKNPNYKYIFIINTPSLKKAICYNCGRPNMSTVTRKEEASIQSKMCPTNNWGNDIFTTWNNYTHERCTACGYEGEEWVSQITYTASCLNGDNPPGGGDWIVAYSYTQSAGYPIHQSLRWWTEYSYE